MSRPTVGQMQRAAAKKAGKVWTAFTQIAITEKMRNDNLLLQNCYAIYANSRYEVHLFMQPSAVGAWMQCAVRSHADMWPIDWSILQRIKNEIFSPGALALELYPEQANEWPAKINVRIFYVAPTTFEIPFGLHLPGAWGRSDG